MLNLALLSFLLTAAAAVQIHVPDIPVSGARTNITWTKTGNDQAFTIFLSDASDFLNLKGILARKLILRQESLRSLCQLSEKRRTLSRRRLFLSVWTFCMVSLSALT
ncbi:hypothetical protein HGRIS_006187 [Hohenbuehelia grisea]|uniref:Uncharacterized protein n=1 Tax=Hohenbuehelia grisea TaxID=104357 RepID=A0ABR3JZ29_9AGAR